MTCSPSLNINDIDVNLLRPSTIKEKNMHSASGFNKKGNAEIIFLEI